MLGADVRDERNRRPGDRAQRAIWPSPRMPISATTISVSGSRRKSVSGRPISLFRLRSDQIVGACGAQRAPRMSFVDVLPADPTTATTRASLFERTARRAPRARHPDRRGRASPRRARVPASTYWTPVFRATKRSPGPTSARVGLDARDASSGTPPSRRPRSSSTISCQRRTITALPARPEPGPRAPPARPRGRRTGWTTPAMSCPCSCPLPAITTTSPGSARPIARWIAERRSGSISASSPVPCSTSSMIASGFSAARVVRGHDHDVRALHGRLAHERSLPAIAVAARAEDHDDAAVRRDRARPREPCRASRAYARSRRGR